VHETYYSHNVSSESGHTLCMSEPGTSNIACAHSKKAIQMMVLGDKVRTCCSHSFHSMILHTSSVNNSTHGLASHGAIRLSTQS
jgi:hypothetical protein